MVADLQGITVGDGSPLDIVGHAVVVHSGVDPDPRPEFGVRNGLAGLRRHITPIMGRRSMGFLNDRKILITGLLSSRSIAYGIAQACQREGATLAFTYVNDDLHERVRKLAAEFGSAPVLRCDVTRDDQIAALFECAARRMGRARRFAACDRICAA